MQLSGIPAGTAVFIDANIFVYHFSANSRFNQACTIFLTRVEAGNLRGITSSAVILEAPHRLMVEEAVLANPGIKPKDIVKHLKTHPDDVKKLILHQTVPQKINQLNIEVLSVDFAAVEASQTIKAESGFLTNDALILKP